MNLADLTLSQASTLLRQRELSPIELTRACLERIEQLNPHLHCFITLTPELAIQQAKEAEATFTRRTSQVTPLTGIPLALKDLFETAGVRTTAGSLFFAEYVPEQDAAVVEKLKLAGAVLLGKLNLHEIALGVTNENPHYGDCRNPWNPKHISGGSSGGSAVALAVGLCLGALGSDTGGSIRIPSSLCGTVGLKSTRGRISLRGVIPLSWSLDHAGPMARTVEDTAILFRAIAGYDPRDPYSVKAPLKNVLAHLQEGVQGRRVALASDGYFMDTNLEVQTAVEQAAKAFEELGARVSNVPFPGASDAAQANTLVTQAEAAVFHRERLTTQPERFGADVLKRLQNGAAFTISEYIQARHLQAILTRQFELFFEGYDILLTPTTPIPAPQRGGDAVERARQLTRFTSPFNLTGLPAISLPCGFTSTGLPIGLQIIARPWAEAEVLRAAYAYEQAAGWQLIFNKKRAALNVQSDLQTS